MRQELAHEGDALVGVAPDDRGHGVELPGPDEVLGEAGEEGVGAVAEVDPGHEGVGDVAEVGLREEGELLLEGGGVQGLEAFDEDLKRILKCYYKQEDHDL